MERTYELMFIVNPDLGEEAAETLLQRIKGYLEAGNATIAEFKDWGLRRLAYAINRKRDGHYYLVHFSMDSGKVKELERNILLAEGIMRELIVLMEEQQPKAVPASETETPEAEPVASSEPDVEEPEEAASPTLSEEVAEES
ncbi:MAG: 30S ribosomal protein S6 [Anaerolineae bacterium]|jgi:small subunit ribosomal protein S6|nr:30S ribosomal protein S6 [Anaerolineae bacterium]